MELFLQETSSLFYHHYDIRLVATNDTVFLFEFVRTTFSF